MTKAPLSPLAFQAGVLGAKTLAKGGTALTFILPDQYLKQIARLLECKRAGYVLEVSAVPMKPDTKKPKETKRVKRRRVQRYPYRADS